MTTETIVTIIAILAGPVFAVLITRWIDDYRVTRARRWDTFRELMRYRRNPMTPNFVGALNLIEVEFYDDEKVIKAWKELLAEFERIAPEKLSEEQIAALYKKRYEAQTRLISAVAENLGQSIEQLDIHGGYSPRAWDDLEAEQANIRQLVRGLADGSRALQVVYWDGEKYKKNKTP